MQGDRDGSSLFEGPPKSQVMKQAQAIVQW